MFCDDVRIFKKEKKRGQAKPQVTIRQRFSDWMDGTMETRSFVSAVHRDADDNGSEQGSPQHQYKADEFFLSRERKRYL